MEQLNLANPTQTREFNLRSDNMKHLLLISLILLSFGCGKSKNVPVVPPPPGPPLTETQERLRSANVDYEGIDGLSGHESSDNPSYYYAMGQKDGNVWLGIINNNKLVLDHIFKNDPKTVDVGYGEIKDIKPSGWGIGVENNNAVSFQRTFSENPAISSSDQLAVGQTIYDKTNNTIADSLYISDGTGVQYPILSESRTIPWYKTNYITFNSYLNNTFLLDDHFGIIEVISNSAQTHGTILSILDNYNYIACNTYESNDSLIVFSASVTTNKSKWNTYIFKTTQSYKVDFVKGKIEDDNIVITAGLIFKDGSKDTLEQKINISTGDIVE